MSENIYLVIIGLGDGLKWLLNESSFSLDNGATGLPKELERVLLADIVFTS